jgi:hypothetical protein
MPHKPLRLSAVSIPLISEIHCSENNLDGHLWSTGWHAGCTHGEMLGQYTMQSAHNKNDPTGYINLHETQPSINISNMDLVSAYISNTWQIAFLDDAA